MKISNLLTSCQIYIPVVQYGNSDPEAAGLQEFWLTKVESSPQLNSALKLQWAQQADSISLKLKENIYLD